MPLLVGSLACLLACWLPRTTLTTNAEKKVSSLIHRTAVIDNTRTSHVTFDFALEFYSESALYAYLYSTFNFNYDSNEMEIFSVN